MLHLQHQRSAARLSLFLFFHQINERVTHSSLWTDTLSELFVCVTGELS